MTEKVALVVMTAHKGVFFGYGMPTDAPTITLERCRMCIYWPEQVKGSFGLAATGPLRGSKIGPAVPSVILRDVTAVLMCTDTAVKAWEAEPWQ